MHQSHLPLLWVDQSEQNDQHLYHFILSFPSSRPDLVAPFQKASSEPMMNILAVFNFFYFIN